MWSQRETLGWSHQWHFNQIKNSMKLCNALVHNIFGQSQRNLAHITTVALLWCVQDFVAIGWAHFKPEHSKLWLNFEFDGNLISGTRKIWHLIVRSCKVSKASDLYFPITLGYGRHPGNIVAKPLAIFQSNMCILMPNFPNPRLCEILQSDVSSNTEQHYDDVTRMTVSLKSLVIQLFVEQLVWTHIKETSKSALLALCEGNSLVTGEFPSQRASKAEKASMWWCYHGILKHLLQGVLQVVNQWRI